MKAVSQEALDILDNILTRINHINLPFTFHSLTELRNAIEAELKEQQVEIFAMSFKHDKKINPDNLAKTDNAITVSLDAFAKVVADKIAEQHKAPDKSEKTGKFFTK